MKIKIVEKTEGCMPKEFEIGEWFDVSAAEAIALKCPYAKTLSKKYKDGQVLERRRNVVFSDTLIPLGFCMQLPKGYEALVVPRSSTFKRYGIIMTNSIGIIDSSYCGNNDEWKFPALATRTVDIPKGVRIAQIKIQLSQKATIWQKIKWLFTKKPKFIKVEKFDTKDRGGIGEGTKI